ncbi:MAG: family 20 glycosylhydrolase [Acidimicrobiales bacterium]|nr:family 20 glycosylhydrolase [Acidimicrobiales bacterium]
MAVNLDDLVSFDGSPAFEHRAYMLDISRDRVPTIETLHWLVDVLAALRYSELQLYTEHTYAFAGHEAVWAEASPLTADDLRGLSGYAAERGVTLVANLNTFGHMERWLTREGYRDRAECPDGPPADLGFIREPSCLAPNPANAEFAVALARELLEVLPTGRVMIGGDEPFELGHGVSAPLAAEIGRDSLYREHLGRIIEPLLAEGHEVLFWGDQFRIDPASVEWIPDGATCVIWNYEAPSDTGGLYGLLPPSMATALGLPSDAHLGFESHARLGFESGKPVWLAAGTSTWNTFLGRNTNAAGNIDDAAVVGSAHRAAGLMVTDWGDNGHWQPLAVSLPSMVRGGVAGWSGRAVDSTVAVGAIVDRLLGAPDGTGALIDGLGRVCDDLGLLGINGAPIFHAAIDTGLGSVGALDRAEAQRVHTEIEDAARHFAAQVDATRWGGHAQELAAACGAASLGVRALLGDRPAGADRAQVIDAQRAAWLRSSRPGGLSDSLGRLLGSRHG